MNNHSNHGLAKYNTTSHPEQGNEADAQGQLDSGAAATETVYLIVGNQEPRPDTGKTEAIALTPGVLSSGSSSKAKKKNSGSGAPPSNTAPANYINPPETTKLLRFGVDSLYLSYPGKLASE
ncbi:MAG: hypothetical protein PSV18_10415 [Methylobacter sp.]|nr:hypothetical protein [Candidatus Methylobacter titanis]